MSGIDVHLCVGKEKLLTLPVRALRLEGTGQERVSPAVKQMPSANAMLLGDAVHTRKLWSLAYSIHLL